MSYLSSISFGVVGPKRKATVASMIGSCWRFLLARSSTTLKSLGGDPTIDNHQPPPRSTPTLARKALHFARLRESDE